MSNMEDEVKKNAKIFFRFLKDEGIYRSFLRYFNNPVAFNSVRKDFPDKNIYFFIRTYGIKYLITILIFWHSTSEGHDFWQKKHEKFINYCDKHDIK